MLELLENIKNYKIILASKSPRRQQILKDLGLHFEINVIDGIEEDYDDSLTDKEVVTYLASHKAEAYINNMGANDLIITADTIVSLEGEILEKPTSKQDAIAMLQKLSDAVHTVLTGVCIMTKEKKVNFTAQTAVHFKKLSNQEIEYYVTKYKPYDKAGAYGIQEWIGYIGIDKIEGSYFNVMGLPVQKLYEELRKF